MTRKVSRSVAQIHLGFRESVSTGLERVELVISDCRFCPLVQTGQFGFQERLGTCQGLRGGKGTSVEAVQTDSLNPLFP